MVRSTILLILCALCLLASCSGTRTASNLEVRTTGDARVYGVYTSGSYGGGRR
ncbi:hypothetical protein DesfrDRAFT_2929 [Solidesulfovibrio fructosivorans JJ]]|uniref:Lipoprotein n=1 Tax=Solidesulfovibrio fructosivorans JJ] TaxID=596151 RepID=E1JZ80_SOLFR|nr:hypothetical protein DesfrDRAFT_2929 [Solidesulfovibrio fructosivorans JJ]]